MRKPKKRFKQTPSGIKVMDKRLAAAERDREKQWSKYADIAKRLYDEWKTSLLGQQKVHVDDLVLWLNNLAARFEKEIPDKEFTDAHIAMIERKIGDVYLAGKTIRFTIRVHAVCPNEIKIGTEIGICNWAGDMLVNRSKWADGKARIDCPECGKAISQHSMKPVVITNEPPPERN